MCPQKVPIFLHFFLSSSLLLPFLPCNTLRLCFTIPFCGWVCPQDSKVPRQKSHAKKQSPVPKIWLPCLALLTQFLFQRRKSVCCVRWIGHIIPSRSGCCLFFLMEILGSTMGFPVVKNENIVKVENAFNRYFDVSNDSFKLNFYDAIWPRSYSSKLRWSYWGQLSIRLVCKYTLHDCDWHHLFQLVFLDDAPDVCLLVSSKMKCLQKLDWLQNLGSCETFQHRHWAIHLNILDHFWSECSKFNFNLRNSCTFRSWVGFRLVVVIGIVYQRQDRTRDWEKDTEWDHQGAWRTQKSDGG